MICLILAIEFTIAIIAPATLGCVLILYIGTSVMVFGIGFFFSPMFCKKQIIFMPSSAISTNCPESVRGSAFFMEGGKWLRLVAFPAPLVAIGSGWGWRSVYYTSARRSACFANVFSPIWLVRISIKKLNRLHDITMRTMFFRALNWRSASAPLFLVSLNTRFAVVIKAVSSLLVGVVIFSVGGFALLATLALLGWGRIWGILLHVISSLIASGRAGDCCKQSPGISMRFTPVIVSQTGGLG